ncbi:MAG: DeoR/GlpR family DNA-binding transcription regulator [Candidatus Brocadiaceae bacterium]
MARLLAEEGELSTASMAERFDVSKMTIRRDLDALQQSGAAVRCYGGAVAAERITFEFAFDERRRRRLAEKERIGRRAAQQVEEGQTVFLDTGTTTLQVARALIRRGTSCTAITSSLVIASELWGCRQIELMLVGGRVREGSPDLVGAGTEEMLDRLTADIAFIGSDGIDPERGSFAGDMAAAGVAQRMVADARRAVVVADSSKLSRAGAVRYARPEEIDELITDTGAEESAVAALRRRGVHVTLV